MTWFYSIFLQKNLVCTPNLSIPTPSTPTGGALALPLPLVDIMLAPPASVYAGLRYCVCLKVRKFKTFFLKCWQPWLQEGAETHFMRHVYSNWASTVIFSNNGTSKKFCTIFWKFSQGYLSRPNKIVSLVVLKDYHSWKFIHSTLIVIC